MPKKSEEKDTPSMSERKSCIEGNKKRIEEIDEETVKLNELIEKSVSDMRRLQGNLKTIKAETETEVKKNLAASFASKSIPGIVDDILTMPLKSAKTVQLEESVLKLATSIKWADDEKRRLAFEKSTLIQQMNDELVTTEIKNLFTIGVRFFDAYKVVADIVEEGKRIASKLSSLESDWNLRVTKTTTPPELKAPSPLVLRFVDFYRSTAGMSRISALTLLDRFSRDLEWDSQRRPETQVIPAFAKVRQERPVIES
jgi:hypothetical protein